MTTEAKKSVRAAAGVLVCLAAIAGGAIWRDRLELGIPEQTSISNLVASTSKRTDLPETKFFEDMMELLKRKYVDPIGDDTKLADGAVRGMVASLGDPDSLYMDPDQYRVYSGVGPGKYEGIGADLVLSRDRPHAKVQISGDDVTDDPGARLPKLVIAAIVPGSAADKAGLKPGDWAEFVDDHWVPNSDAFDKLIAAEDNLIRLAKGGQADPKIVPEYQRQAAEYLKMRSRLHDEAEKNILPIKARNRLMMGTSGFVHTQWVRGVRRIEANLERGVWTMPGFAVQQNGSIRLPFIAGSSDLLRQALGGKAEATIDLRNNVAGDFNSMLACLRLVAPNGTYGYLVTRKNEKPQALTISDGSSRKMRVTLLVDETTRGAAEIFALALSSRGIARLSGSGMAGDRNVVQWFSLPDKAGYTLVTAEYRTNEPTGVVAKAVIPDPALVRPDPAVRVSAPEISHVPLPLRGGAIRSDKK
ncbi:MAG: S41 family peptidase [Fimbriimonadales bacterium]